MLELVQLRTDLQASLHACRGLAAEAKIHREAWEAEADKGAALSARYDALQAEASLLRQGLRTSWSWRGMQSRAFMSN